MKNLIFQVAILATVFLFSISFSAAQSNEGQRSLYSNNGQNSLVEGNKAGTFRYQGRTDSGYVKGIELTSIISGPVSPGILPTDFFIRTGSPNLTDRFRVRATGEIGINISNPESQLTVRQFYEATNPDKNAFEVIGGNNEVSIKRFRLFNENGLLNASLDGNMSINEGKLLIGTTNISGSHKVMVGGSIICTKLIVEEELNWPDYVFAPTYQLKPLRQLKREITQLGHLPGVPSAKKVKENGVDVGEMNRILLEKVEELTLYIIQQQEEIEKLKSTLGFNNK